ncbi:MAG: MtnX-like HAD-IB family phosphatase [Candidatus Heimdallarchaeaceae archaeon]
MSYAIFCDFDGTITLKDVGKTLLTKFSRDDWQYYDKLVINGEIGTREALIKQWGTVKANQKEIFDVVDQISIDPSFHSFFEWVKEHNIHFIVVSDGFQEYIEEILEKEEIDSSSMDIRANNVKIVNNSLVLSFITEECEHGCANCKYSHVLDYKKKGNKIIYIGDGLSDILPARELADVIFAKEGEDLAKKLKGDPRVIEFSNFEEIKTILEEKIFN